MSIIALNEQGELPKAVIYGCEGLTLNDAEREFFEKENPLGFILFARNCENPVQVQQLVDELKATVAHRDALILIDQEGGRVARLRPPHWPDYPSARTLANLADKNVQHAGEAIYLNSRLIAEDLTYLGINVDCLPLADVPVEGSHDIIGDRAYGTDPERVATLAREAAQGLMDSGVLPVLKHIPGHGRATVDSHLDLPEVTTSLEELRNTDFAPFRELADLPLGMTAHVLYTGIDPYRVATLSPDVITLIREEIGFNGLLMTDDLSMKALKGDFAKLAHDSLAAGCDVVLHCNGNMEEMRAISTAVHSLNSEAAARALRAERVLKNNRPFDGMVARQRMAKFLTEANTAATA
ncbi:MAG: beta-N-acetylhexosaminidase [Alphaproteobacteria bacterium]|nr:beta-N-acetylhexosaminidase [Alphaproteobacteria bacterium]